MLKPIFSAILLAFFIVQNAEAISEEMQELIDNLHKTCVGVTGAAEDLIVNARTGNFADDENLKCYMKCIFDEMGVMQDDGTLDIDAACALLPPDLAPILEPIVRSCGNKIGASACETVWKTNQCWYQGSPANYFLP